MEKRVCRVCGKKFRPCKVSPEDLGAFNYRTICCSSECGAEYFERVRISREEQTEEVDEPKAKKSAKKDKVEVKNSVVVVENDNVL